MRPTPTCSASISRRAAVWLAVIGLSLVLGARADEASLEIITLHHRPAAELLPVLRPFLAKDGVLKADDDKLIVRTTSANLTELRKLIAELDRPLRRLLIEVKQLSGERARDNVGAATETIGEHSRGRLKVWRTDSRDDADRLQQVQVTEGGQAFIDVGRQIPLSDFTLEQDGNGTRITQDTRYAGATTGFYASPHLNGDTVTLDITPHQTTAENASSAPVFDVQSLHTTVSGRLGEWIELGTSTADTDVDDSGAITYSTSRRAEEDRRILLRVTVVQ